MSRTIIIYESRVGKTEMMAKAIEEGIKEAGVDAVLKRATNAKAKDLANFDAVVLGSPTYHHNMIQPMQTFLFEMEKANLKGKVGASFGSYGWSGEAVQMMSDTMKHIFEMDVIEPGLKIQQKPDENGLQQCREFGRAIAEKIKGK
ncbi:MAG: FprA family A-type flavoprotein [Dehalococcoidia bacterium]|nr:FprA family A-type flavoprotein [Dehalococcoidia bacterium]